MGSKIILVQDAWHLILLDHIYLGQLNVCNCFSFAEAITSFDTQTLKTYGQKAIIWKY